MKSEPVYKKAQCSIYGRVCLFKPNTLVILIGGSLHVAYCVGLIIE
jgi:hypothetical protein